MVAFWLKVSLFGLFWGAFFYDLTQIWVSYSAWTQGVRCKDTFYRFMYEIYLACLYFIMYVGFFDIFWVNKGLAICKYVFIMHGHGYGTHTWHGHRHRHGKFPKSRIWGHVRAIIFYYIIDAYE